MSERTLEQRIAAHRGVARPHRAFEGGCAAGTIERLLSDCLGQRRRVPMLAERCTREPLHAAARREDP